MYPAALTNLENSNELRRFSGSLAVAVSIAGESAVINGLPALVGVVSNGAGMFRRNCNNIVIK